MNKFFNKNKKLILIGLLAILGLICILIVVYSQLFVWYPIRYSEYVEKYSEINGLDTRLVYSVIKVESAFREDVKSNANAIGLMQIKLSTAIDMENNGSINITENDLLDPETNIKYGCRYLKYLFDYYKGNTLNALCAYNAGLSNVNNWLVTSEYIDENGTLIIIPFDETRNYINKINKTIKIYNLYYKWGKIK